MRYNVQEGPDLVRGPEFDTCGVDSEEKHE